MQFFCGPVLGMLSDRFGRRPVMLISILGLALDFLVMAFAPTLAWLLLGRVLNGLTAASFSTANAYVADVSTPRHAGAQLRLDERRVQRRLPARPGRRRLPGHLPVHIGALQLDRCARRSWSPPGSAPSTGSTASSCCRSRCRPSGGIAAFDWRRANPVASLSLLRVAPGPAAAGQRQLPVPARPAGAAQHLRALHHAALPLVAELPRASPSSSPARSASWCRSFVVGAGGERASASAAR